MCRMHESSSCPIPSPAKLVRVKIVQVLYSVYHDAQSNVCKARYDRASMINDFLMDSDRSRSPRDYESRL